MKTKFILVTVCSGMILFACKNDAAKEKSDVKKDTTMVVDPKVDPVKYNIALVDNLKDPSCGMPLTAGIGDTAHYNNKTIGFCSKECKDFFLKDAAKNFTAVEWKK